MSFKAREADNYKTLSMPISYAKTLFSLILAKLESSNKFITCTFKLYSYDKVKGNATKHLQKQVVYQYREQHPIII